MKAVERINKNIRKPNLLLLKCSEFLNKKGVIIKKYKKNKTKLKKLDKRIRTRQIKKKETKSKYFKTTPPTLNKNPP